MDFLDSKMSVLLGVIGLGFMGWISYDILQKRKEITSQLNYFEQLDRELKANPINYSQIKNKKISKDVILNQIKPRLNDNTLKIRKRQVSRHDIHYQITPYFRRVCGGNFIFTKDGNNFECNLKECTISSSVLDIQYDPVKLFKETNLQPLVSNVQITLNPCFFLTIYGTLSYNPRQGKFLIEPKIIGKNIAQISDIIGSQRSSTTVSLFLIGCAAALVSYYVILKPCFKGLKAYFAKKTQKNNMEHFHNLGSFSSSQNQKLICTHCKNNSSNIVFQCGHICICDVCEQQGIKKCSLCGKQSTKVLKIFIA